MRVFFDTEFIDDGRRIHPISIGLVREDGAEYYAEFDDCPVWLAGDWVKKNVLAKLTGESVPRDKIKANIVEFSGEDPEFWAYFADYDWVLMCQLFGTMMELPEGWPKFCMDLKQRLYEHGDPSVQRPESDDHHALADARWVAKTWRMYEKARFL